MKQKQTPGTVWEDAQGRKYTDTIILPLESKQYPDGSLFLQAGIFFDEDALDNEPFMKISFLFPKDPEIKEFVPLKDENGTILLDNEGTPIMDAEKTTFVHHGGPLISENLIYLSPINNPLAFTPKNRASQIGWNEFNFYKDLKIGDYYEFEGGLLPE